MLKKIETGFNGNLQYFDFNRRVSVLESYTKILIFPELHLNTISFMGILSESDYLTFKVVNDTYIALGKDNVLYTWSLITGKLLCQNPLKGKDYSKY